MKKFNRVLAGSLALAALLPAAPAIAQEKPHRFEACKADVQKFCADVPRGQGKVKACLEANKDKLSDECKAAREKAASTGTPQ